MRLHSTPCLNQQMWLNRGSRTRSGAFFASLTNKEIMLVGISCINSYYWSSPCLVNLAFHKRLPAWSPLIHIHQNFSTSLPAPWCAKLNSLQGSRVGCVIYRARRRCTFSYTILGNSCVANLAMKGQSGYVTSVVILFTKSFTIRSMHHRFCYAERPVHYIK